MTSSQLNHLSSMLENLWANFDELFDSLDDDGWQTPHGSEWIFADVPYHLAYFDRYIARYLEQGPGLPKEEHLSLVSLNDMNCWNAAEFARRPENQTPAQSVAEMCTARDEIRRLLAGLDDADLERPAWMFLLSLRGWRTVRGMLGVCLMHTWNEFVQFRLHMGRETPKSDPVLLRFCLAAFLAYLQSFINVQLAAETHMNVVYDFPGVGVWTVQIGDGQGKVTEGHRSDAKIVFTQNPTTMMKTFNGMHDPAVAMQTGEIRVQGFEHLPTFAALYPPPAPDKVIPAFP